MTKYDGHPEYDDGKQRESVLILYGTSPFNMIKINRGQARIQDFLKGGVQGLLKGHLKGHLLSD